MEKEKTQAQINTENKIKKIHKLAEELQISLKAALIPSENSLTAAIIYTDHEKYPEETKPEETPSDDQPVEKSAETATA